ncbi:MAG: SDR family oxidoreductase [Faecalibacterium sp.]
MKALFIGGTGTISTSVVALALAKGWDVTLLNRGQSGRDIPEGARVLQADARDAAAVNAVLGDETFDVVAQFVAFVPEQVENDIALYQNRTKQYIFISSASAYQKPARDYVITESTPLVNPYWQYSRDKAACEDLLMQAHIKQGFPVTIVRPSHTYCDTNAPVGANCASGSWPTFKRMLEGKPVIIHGDGTSLWTMTNARDFAKGFVGLMGNAHAIGNAVHITTDEGMTWNQIYQLYADALGVPLNAVHIASDFLAAHDDGMDFTGALIGDKGCTVVFDNSKIKRLVPGFACTISMSEGLTNAMQYMVTHPDQQTEDPTFDAWCDKMIAAQQAAHDFLK